MIKILWQQERKQFDLSTWFRPTILIDIASILYGTTLLISLFYLSSVTEILFILSEATASLAIGVLNFSESTKDYLLSKTVGYEVEENGLVFYWGLLNRKREVVSFESISKIECISNRNKNGATFIIESLSDVDFRGYDDMMSRRRKTPSFENIRNPDELIRILEQEQKKNDHNFILQDNRSLPLSEYTIYERQRQNVSRNLVLSRSYLFIVVLIGLYYTDVNILNNTAKKDTIAWSTYSDNTSQTGSLFKYHTINDRTFSTSKHIGKTGDNIDLFTSPFYQSVNGLIVNGKDLSKTLMSGFNGLSKLLYTMTCIFLLIGSLFIRRREGIIIDGDIGFAFVIPITFLGLSIVNWLYQNVHLDAILV